MVVAAIVLAAVRIVLGVRTARLTSKQIRAPAPESVDLDQKRSADRLSKAIQFKTVSGKDRAEIDPQPFLALHAFLKKAFPLTHERLQPEVVGGFSLLYTWEGTDPTRRPFMLMSHIDVVAVEADREAQWTHRGRVRLGPRGVGRQMWGVGDS